MVLGVCDLVLDWLSGGDGGVWNRIPSPTNIQIWGHNHIFLFTHSITSITISITILVLSILLFTSSSSSNNSSHSQFSQLIT